jgi:hypothetical protein
MKTAKRMVDGHKGFAKKLNAKRIRNIGKAECRKG